MKKTKQFAIRSALAASTLIGCSKNDDVPSPKIVFSTYQDSVKINFKESFEIEATVYDFLKVDHQWKIKDSVYSSNPKLIFKAPAAGFYTIEYTGSSLGGNVTRKIVVEVNALVRPITSTSSKYISRVFDYLPAPGQFVNEASFGTPANAQKLIGQPSILVTLGGFGGYVIFGFDHSITNRQGYDLAIYGNPIKPPMEWSEPGAVMVSQDVNANGIPDDPWYELAGSEYNHPTTIKNYAITYRNPKAYADVTWTDNQGGSGAVEINNYHRHNYYPEFAPNQETITFTGTRVRNTFGLLPGTGIYINKGFDYGYADSWSAGDNFETNRYNSFDLSWAVNANGAPVQLSAIDFVKVYNAQNDKGNRMLGEASTEVRGAADLNMP